MKKIYCDINMFELDQRVYIVDSDSNIPEAVSITTLEDLPEVINTICNNEQIDTVCLGGCKAYVEELSESILTCAEKKYNQNNIIVEVLG